MREHVSEVPGAAVWGLSPSCAGQNGWAMQNNCECPAACEHQQELVGVWGSTRSGVRSGSYTVLASGELVRMLRAP